MKTELLKWKDAANTGKSAIKIIEAQLINFILSLFFDWFLIDVYLKYVYSYRAKSYL